MTATYLLSTKEILWKIIATYGHDPQVVFSPAGLTHDMLLNQGARISHKTVDHLWDRATKVVKDPASVCVPLNSGIPLISMPWDTPGWPVAPCARP